MPTSHYHQLNELTGIIYRLQPVSLLDVGVGFGKYGFLAREYLELWSSSNDYSKRTRRIDGIEIFSAYLHDGHEFIYDKIFKGDVLGLLPHLPNYDLILLIDVLEHFSEEDGKKLLNELVHKSRYVLISTPKDIGKQTAAFGNEFETHRYQWTRKDFNEYKGAVILPHFHSWIALLGPESKKIISNYQWEVRKLKLRSSFPLLYKIYRKLKNK